MMNFGERLLAITDLETTGLERLRKENPAREDLTPWHEVCEMGLVLARPKTLDIVDTWSRKVKINYPHRMSQKAQEINGYNEELWYGAAELRDAVKTYGNFAKGAVFAAWNDAFDWGFLEIAAASCDIELELDYHRIDLYTFARTMLEVRGIYLPSYNLSAVAEHLKLGAEPMPHSALNGAKKAYEVFKALFALPLANSKPPINPAAGCQKETFYNEDDSTIH